MHNHFMHPSSCACGKSELELFPVPPTQTAIESSQWVEYRPISTLSDSSHIEFVITGSGEEYLNLSKTYLQVTAKLLEPDRGELGQIRASDGSVSGDDADVDPVNLWLHSLFSQVDVSLNECLVMPSMNTYPYQAYLETSSQRILFDCCLVVQRHCQTRGRSSVEQRFQESSGVDHG